MVADSVVRARPPGEDGSADPLVSSRVSRASMALVRVAAGMLWIQGTWWKVPPRFGEGDPPTGLYQWTSYAVEHQVFGPFAWLVEHLVLPNFALFGWLVLLTEASLGAFLLVGLATRWWALVGMAQTTVITLSAWNAPHEWVWSYPLMFLVHLAIFACAAGRYGGLDGVLRPRWAASPGRPARLLAMAS
jgi:thiosulfate dehydrogenase [quinone] large subunit